MKLQQLLHNIAEYPLSAKDVQVRGLSLHSQQIKPGEVFIALKGHQQDGRVYISDAIAKGANAVIYEAEEANNALFSQPITQSVPMIPVYRLATHLGSFAQRFYGELSATLPIVGVTGTSGKTTSCFLLAQSLDFLNIPCAVLGTLGYGFVQKLQPCALTTPDALALHQYLLTLQANQAQTVAMEVSSHALVQERVNHINFDCAMFTNLSQDHLDYHGNMAAYGQAKQKLFEFSSLQRAIVNADSNYAPAILQALRKDIPLALYTLDNTLDALLSFVDGKSFFFPIRVKQYTSNYQGISADIDTPWGEGHLRSPLFGKFNLSNLLGVLAELCLRGIVLKDALEALSLAKGALGRMQCIRKVGAPLVIVDYSHKPDALENALKTSRLHSQGLLWCVFGCGGDRDKLKRPLMGNIAGLYADRVVVTSDNPRTENPHAIIQDILQDLKSEYTSKIMIESDRAKAINYAMRHASPQDTILIAGKGHEDYQIIGNEKIHFSDVEWVNALLEGEMKACQ